MKVLIIEDEILAEQTLCRALERNFPDMEVIGVTRSVKSTVEWARNHIHETDIVFMDVELEDGCSFKILEQMQIPVPIIITTAYSKYGIKAFEVGSIDYLMKPVTDDALLRAVNRACRFQNTTNNSSLLDTLKEFMRSGNDDDTYKKRFILHSDQSIIPVEVKDIAYFYLEGKSTYLVNTNGQRHFICNGVETLIDGLNPSEFFRISRNYIVSIHAVESIDRLKGSRLKIKLNPPPDEEVIVTRARVQEFLEWIS